MKYWKDEIIRYFHEFLSVHPFSQTFQMIVTVIAAISLADYYEIPSIIIAILPLPVLLILAGAAAMLIISWILGLHVLDMLKITSFTLNHAYRFPANVLLTVFLSPLCS